MIERDRRGWVHRRQPPGDISLATRAPANCSDAKRVHADSGATSTSRPTSLLTASALPWRASKPDLFVAVGQPQGPEFKAPNPSLASRLHVALVFEGGGQQIVELGISIESRADRLQQSQARGRSCRDATARLARIRSPDAGAVVADDR